jgi:hypothetical protein
MRQFYEAWEPVFANRQPTIGEIRPLSTDEIEIDLLAVNRPLLVDDLQSSDLEYFLSIGFTHHYELLIKTDSLEERLFYIQCCATKFWSVEKLKYNLKSNLYAKQGKLPNNFKTTISDMDLQRKALLSFKDEYLLDYINIQCLVAIELKRGNFKPEYLGKMNFYLSALDDLVRLPHENRSISIILCKSQKQNIVEYAFRDMTKPMGVATYKVATKLPDEYKNILPDAEQLKQLL